MSAILDLPEMRARVARWSVDAYEQLVELGVLGKGVELIRGVIIQKMPKSPLHFTLTQRLCARFRRHLPTGYTVRQEGPLRLADSEPEPDVAVVRGLEQEFISRHPTTAELIVEVAVSSAALDRENASLYAQAGVPEYWRLYSVGETLACESVPGLQAPLEDWFA